LAEIVEQSGGGLVYDTEEDLHQAIDRLLADSSYRRKLGQRGYEAYQQNWTAEAYVKRYLSVIAEGAGRGSGRSPHPLAVSQKEHGAEV
jgi:glycosyltransferase involved in cell wall biosynthesis